MTTTEPVPDITIGLMSGTSMDGVDAAAVAWGEDERPRMLAALTRPFALSLAVRLRRLGPTTSLAEVADCDAAVAEAFADAALTVMEAAGIAAADVMAIGSHGQTVWHAPDREPPASVQIGDPNRIAEHTGVTVVADFRRRDMAAGGQGAPLAPVFHAALFPSSRPRAVVNIGGIANISWLEPGCEHPVGGNDIGPGNILMDAWYRQHVGDGFDEGGGWAASGEVQERWLETLLAEEPYFHRNGPRSTGPEIFNLAWLHRHGADAHRPVDVQATLLELTARTIADEVSAAADRPADVLVCGGGANNTALMRRLCERLHPLPVADTGSVSIAPEFVEAIGFAWLARRTLAGLPGNHPAVTGAARRVVLGGIYPA